MPCDHRLHQRCRRNGPADLAFVGEIEERSEHMHIAHLAIWAKDLENLKAFYEHYFGAQASPKYSNGQKHFQSYFLTFTSGARLELMSRPDISSMATQPGQEHLGYAHLAMSVG